MVLVVASFSASLLYSNVRLASIEDEALAITSDAAPAIQHLAAARSELLRLGVAANGLIFGPRERVAMARVELAASRRALERELAAWQAIPMFPGEWSVAGPAAAELAELDLVLDEAEAQWARGSDNLTARAVEFERLSRRRAELSHRLEELIDFHAGAIRDRTAAIRRERDRALDGAAVLGVISIIAAAIATLLVLRAMRQHAMLTTEHRHILETRADELEAFAGRVAHDLRNPLGSMALVIAIAQQRHSDPGFRASLAELTRRLEGMSQIIDGLLAFARGGAGGTRDAQASLREVVHQVVSEIAPVADAAGIAIEVAAVPAVAVACPGGVLRSVLANLIHNAVKYIDRASSERRIALAAHVTDDVVITEVTDTGPGIPADKRDAVFEPFVRLTTAGPGIGLGLATVKRLVEAHGGRVGVRAGAGGGSCFWFELPRPARDFVAAVPTPADTAHLSLAAAGGKQPPAG